MLIRFAQTTFEKMEQMTMHLVLCAVTKFEIVFSNSIYIQNKNDNRKMEISSIFTRPVFMKVKFESFGASKFFYNPIALPGCVHLAESLLTHLA